MGDSGATPIRNFQLDVLRIAMDCYRLLRIATDCYGNFVYRWVDELPPSVPLKREHTR